MAGGVSFLGPLKSDDSHFSSGAPDKEERDEWAAWHGDYVEKDYFKAYLDEIKNIPNCNADLLIRRWKKDKDIASFNRIVRAYLKIVPKIAYRIAAEYGHQPSYGIIRDRKKAKQGYEVVVAELICAGNWGLLQAPERFRLDAGTAFATAARCSVEKEIRAHARWLRSMVHMPEGKPSGWYRSLTAYNDDANEYEGDVAVGGVAVSAYQLVDYAIDADPADPTLHAASGTIRNQVCLAELDLAAKALLDRRERAIFRAHYIHGKTLKAIASRRGICFQRVSKIARAARDKVLKTGFGIERAMLPPWQAHEDWLDALSAEPTGRRARIVEFGRRLFPLGTANRLALWRLAEMERETFWPPYFYRIIAGWPLAPEKKTRWRKRKSDAPGLWEPLPMFWNPPREVLKAKPDWGVPALWTFRSTYPARIHVAGTPQVGKARPAGHRWAAYPRPRSGWRKPLPPDDWRLAYQRICRDEFWSNYQPPQKEAA